MCLEPYILSVILLLSEIVYCLVVVGVLAKLLSKLCNSPSELQKGHNCYAEGFWDLGGCVTFFFFLTLGDFRHL